MADEPRPVDVFAGPGDVYAGEQRLGRLNLRIEGRQRGMATVIEGNGLEIMGAAGRAGGLTFKTSAGQARRIAIVNVHGADPADLEVEWLDDEATE
jgi:hypothetical protein